AGVSTSRCSARGSAGRSLVSHCGIPRANGSGPDRIEPHASMSGRADLALRRVKVTERIWNQVAVPCNALLSCSGDPLTASLPVITSVFRYWPGEVGQNWTWATQLCPGIRVVQVLDGTL